MAQVEKNGPLLQEMGDKLANFRRKLATALGLKKITQMEFGEMYGNQTPRMITSYERGEVDPPASMLYLIWQSGNSVDDIFAEKSISETGKVGAKLLYESSAYAMTRCLDDAAINKTLRDFDNEKRNKQTALQAALDETPAQPTASGSKARAVKKHPRKNGSKR